LEEKSRVKAATTMQAFFRGKTTRSAAEEDQKRAVAATKMQAAARGKKEREEAAEMRAAQRI